MRVATDAPAAAPMNAATAIGSAVAKSGRAFFEYANAALDVPNIEPSLLVPSTCAIGILGAATNNAGS